MRVAERTAGVAGGRAAGAGHDAPNPIMLLVAVMVSALYVVRVPVRLASPVHGPRVRANAEAHRLETERTRLEVEKRAEATSLRVEKLARDAGHAQRSTPAITNT